MGDKQLIYGSIVRFLCDEIENGGYSCQVAESIQVAVQCLESAFDIDSETKKISLNLNGSSSENVRQPTEDEIAMAETLKNQGNICMKQNKYEEAVACYTKAIDLSPRNAVYYCNRAAAYSKLEQQKNAIEDCNKALNIDPNYGKAYGRMGLGDYAKAVESYRKGLELDPHNENCQQNLALAEERLRVTPNSGGSRSAPGDAGMPFNLASMMQSPWMQNMVQHLMTNPAAQDIISGVLGNSFGVADTAETSANHGSTTTSTTTARSSSSANTTTTPNSADAGGNPRNGPSETGVDPSIGAFLQLGQQFAQQLQSSNPQLVEQLRQMHQSTVTTPSSTVGDADNPGGVDANPQTRKDG